MVTFKFMILSKYRIFFSKYRNNEVAYRWSFTSSSGRISLRGEREEIVKILNFYWTLLVVEISKFLKTNKIPAGDFTKCVSEASGARLRARTQREARELARRTRHVAHAREHALKDLGPTAVLDWAAGMCCSKMLSSTEATQIGIIPFWG